jgi:hypothetical protein
MMMLCTGGCCSSADGCHCITLVPLEYQGYYDTFWHSGGIKVFQWVVSSSDIVLVFAVIILVVEIIVMIVIASIDVR